MHAAMALIVCVEDTMIGAVYMVDAAVGANVGSEGATAEALAPQEVDISQNLDHVEASATATQDANVSQQ